MKEEKERKMERKKKERKKEGNKKILPSFMYISALLS